MGNTLTEEVKVKSYFSRGDEAESHSPNTMQKKPEKEHRLDDTHRKRSQEAHLTQ